MPNLKGPMSSPIARASTFWIAAGLARFFFAAPASAAAAERVSAARRATAVERVIGILSMGPQAYRAGAGVTNYLRGSTAPVGVNSPASRDGADRGASATSADSATPPGPVP